MAKGITSAGLNLAASMLAAGFKGIDEKHIDLCNSTTIVLSIGGKSTSISNNVVTLSGHTFTTTEAQAADNIKIYDDNDGGAKGLLLVTHAFTQITWDDGGKFVQADTTITFS
jgi:hypothetical protein